MLAKIKRVLTEADLRADLIRGGLEQVKKYNWWECAGNAGGL